MEQSYDKIKKDISIIQIKDIANAEIFLDLLHDRGLPVIGACACINVDDDYILTPTCGNKHVVIVPKRHSEIALELLRSVEEEFSILY